MKVEDSFPSKNIVSKFVLAVIKMGGLEPKQQIHLQRFAGIAVT